jgi:hypothetical protein
MAGWPVSYESGKLQFATITLPNVAMAVIEYGFTQMWSPELVHENRETATATVPYPGVLKGIKASIPLLITGDWSTTGTPYANPVQGLRANLAALNALVTATTTSSGTQTATYTPYVGATPISVTVQVMPVQLGTSATQGGTRAVLDLILPNGAV